MVRARGLEYGGREFESQSLHLKPETTLREERGLSGCRKGLKTVPLAQALLSLKPAKTYSVFIQITGYYLKCSAASSLTRQDADGGPVVKSRVMWLIALAMQVKGAMSCRGTCTVSDH